MKRRAICCDMWKGYKIQILVSLSEVLLEYRHLYLRIIFWHLTLQWQSWVMRQRPSDPQSFPFQKKVTYRWSKP